MLVNLADVLVDVAEVRGLRRMSDSRLNPPLPPAAALSRHGRRLRQLFFGLGCRILDFVAAAFASPAATRRSRGGSRHCFERGGCAPAARRAAGAARRAAPRAEHARPISFGCACPPEHLNTEPATHTAETAAPMPRKHTTPRTAERNRLRTLHTDPFFYPPCHHPRIAAAPGSSRIFKVFLNDTCTKFNTEKFEDCA
jgi:hypothetical protein